jgi:uncharacterized protein YggT (Ycf19 family)
MRAPLAAPNAGGTLLRDMTTDDAPTTARPQPQSSGELVALRVARVLVWFAYAFAFAAAVLLAMAFFLKLTDANDTAPFVEWVYRSTDRLMQPFRSIYPSVEGDQGSVVDFALLFAIFMYGLAAVLVGSLLGWVDRRIVRTRGGNSG